MAILFGVSEMKSNEIAYSDFEKVDLRVGKIVEVLDFPEAHKPAYKLKIDFGPQIGIKQSSAQLVANYTKAELIGKLVVCVVNFPVKQIGPMKSEVLTTGFPDGKGNCFLITVDKTAPLGGKLY